MKANAERLKPTFLHAFSAGWDYVETLADAQAYAARPSNDSKTPRFAGYLWCAWLTRPQIKARAANRQPVKVRA